MRKLLMAVLLSASFIPSVTHAAMQTSAKQAIVIDMGTGMTLLEKNADEKMPTSSMSKVMTGYMIFEALKKGRITMDSEFSISEKAWQKGGSKMFVNVGDKVKVEDLLKGLIVQSGNDAAIALAEGLSGDEDAFAAVMTQKAREIGLNNSNFKNASGWPDADHYSTARDLALLAQKLIVDFPHEYSFYSLKEFTYNGITQPNRNPLLYRDMGVDGIKTGHTDDGGYGLMASGEQDGRRIVMVVNGLESARDRANESARLMSWAMNVFENATIIENGQILENSKTLFAKTASLPLTVDRDIRVTVPKGEKDNVKVNVEYNAPIEAPVKKGQEIGKVNISVPQIGDFSVPLVAAADLEKAGFVGRTFEKMKMMISGE